VEYREAMVRSSEPDLVRVDGDDGLELWLVDRESGTTYATARVVSLSLDSS
jgi:hypothetical protein